MSNENNQGSSSTDQQQFQQIIHDSAISDGSKLVEAGKVAAEHTEKVQQAHGLETKQLVSAAMEVVQVMGPDMRSFVAQLGKSYQGPIVHVKDGLAFQQTAPNAVVVHKVGDLLADSNALKTMAETAQNKHSVSIAYDGTGGAQMENLKTREQERQPSLAKDRGVEMGG